MNGRVGAALTLAACLLAAISGEAIADDSAPGDDKMTSGIAVLRVAGEADWRADNQFAVSWDEANYLFGAVATEIAYRILDEDGNPVSEVTAYPLSTSVAHSFGVTIPAGPGSEPTAGAYLLQTWLRSESRQGPATTATLRLDNSRPGPARPLAPAGWLPSGSTVVVRIEHPAPPLPPSGIGGYAVELDHGSGAEPCGGRSRCTPEEVDLDGGKEDDSLYLGPLAEGTTVVRVAAVSGTGMRSARSEATTLHVDGTPPAIRLTGAPGGWSDHPLELEASASDDLSGMAAAGPTGPVTAIAVDGAAPTVAAGSRVAATVHGSGIHEVAAFARDAVGNTGAADPAVAHLKVRIDESAPRLAFAASQDPDRPERIVAFVDDDLSGPSRERGSIELRPAGSTVPFESLPTAIVGDRLLAAWDSDAYPPGRYEFRAIGFDAAGNRTESNRRSDGAPMVLANPIKATTALVVGFGGRSFLAHRCRRRPAGLRCESWTIADFASRPADTRIAYGRRARLGGKLTSAAGTPLPGRTVTITETFAAGAAPTRRETTAVTGPDGIFLAHLAPGPSRRIAVSFSGDERLTRTVSRELRLAVRSALGLRVSTPTATVGGAPVVFKGRLGRRAATIPLGGVAIELEFRVAGLPWSEFRTVRSDPRGRFRYAYAFSDDDSRGIRFQLRAHVAPQAGWPYDESYSWPVSVTGR